MNPPLLIDRVSDFFQGLGLVGRVSRPESSSRDSSSQDGPGEPSCPPGVVACSGGPDSIALAHVLLTLQDRGILGPLILAHLNHQLRGSESDADEAFVLGLPERLGKKNSPLLTCRSQRIDVAARARELGDNLEKIARQVRYAWLAEVAQTAGATWVATGHTADDQAETVLHRLLRGAGLRGLAGIAPRKPLTRPKVGRVSRPVPSLSDSSIPDGPGGPSYSWIELIRPMLQIRRSKVHAYLQENNLSFCQDSTNVDLRFTRNRIRHELLPALGQVYNPGIVEILCRLAGQARALFGEVQAQAAQLLAEAELPRAGTLLVFHLGPLKKAPRNLVREVFRLVWDREGWPRGKMGFKEWDRLARLEADFDLPGKIKARLVRGILQLGNERQRRLF